MQDFSSTVTYSPSFSFYASGEFAAAAVKISREIQSYNNIADSVNDEEDAGDDFEFETSPLHEETFFDFPTFSPKSNAVVSLSNNKKDDDLAIAGGNIPDKLLSGGVWSMPPSPWWSDFDEFDESFTGSCLWSPIRSSAASEIGKASESSTRTSKRCRLKRFLTRSNSDGANDSSSPSESKRCFLRELMRRSHSDGSKTSSPSVTKGKDNKTASTKVGERGDNKRRKSYLPYRQDLIGVFTGMRKLRN